MDGYQERMIEEKKALDEKLDKLKNFIETSDTFKMLNPADKHLLDYQYDLMSEYSKVLGQRISRFEQTK